MNPVDDEAPTRLREVIQERTAFAAERTKVYRPAQREIVPPANAAATDADALATEPRTPMASPSPAPQAQTVARPLRTRVAATTSAPRSRRRELALRCGLALAVSAVALGVALASTNALPTSERAPSENLERAMPDTTAPVTPVRAPALASTGATDPNAPSTATSPSSARPLDAAPAAAEDNGTTTPAAAPAEAARLLATGAYAPALDAYRALARSEPDEPVYAVIVRVLARNLGARCDRSQTPGDPTCSTRNPHDARHTTATLPSSR